MKNFLVAFLMVLGMASASQAALLATYSYSESQSPYAGVGFDQDLEVRDSNASNFSSGSNGQTGTLVGGAMNTQGLNTFYVDVFVGSKAGTQVTVSKIEFDAFQFTGTSGRSNFAVQYQIGTYDDNLGDLSDPVSLVRLTPDKPVVTGSNPDNPVNTFPISGTNTTYGIEDGSSSFGGTVTSTETALPLTISNGQFVKFRISFMRNGTTSLSGTNRPQVQFDNVKIYGEAVPEPTSIAIFGLMGLGIAAKRFRKK